MMFGMTVLDLLETMVERFVANRGAGLARLEAFAMELVVMVGMLRSGFDGLEAMPASPAPTTPMISRRFMLQSPFLNTQSYKRHGSAETPG